MYKPLDKRLEIRDSLIEGQGLFAKESIPIFTYLGVSHVKAEGYQDGYIRTPLGGFYNHSETPNCSKIELVEGIYQLVTTKEIAIDEELTVRYTFYAL